MHDSHAPAALHAALRFVITSEIPSEHKATLIAVLTQALRDDAAADLRRQSVAQGQAEWPEHEIVQLKTLLQDRIASSWQHADECVMQLSAQLHRDPRSIREKAADLGLSASVDYRFAKALKLSRGE
jgi:hypothetical protein